MKLENAQTVKLRSTWLRLTPVQKVTIFAFSKESVFREKTLKNNFIYLLEKKDELYIRVGKKGSLGPWSRVIVLQGPKDPVLPNLIYHPFNLYPEN